MLKYAAAELVRGRDPNEKESKAVYIIFFLLISYMLFKQEKKDNQIDMAQHSSLNTHNILTITLAFYYNETFLKHHTHPSYLAFLCLVKLGANIMEINDSTLVDTGHFIMLG